MSDHATPPCATRPLVPADGRAAGALTAEVFREFGAEPLYSVEATERIFATDWLANGGGLVLEHGSAFCGYGWARDHDWNGRPFVHVGLFLDRAFRGAGAHEPLSRPLLDLAAELGRRSGIEQALMFYRSVDTAHPRIARALGFRDLPVSMIGFRHNLDCLPDVRLPAGVEARPARLPEDRDVLRLLSGRAFDDPATQGQPMTTSHVDVIAGHPEYLPESITIAWHGTDPVGYLVSCPADVAGSNCSDLAELGVIPEWRGRRVGAGLLCQHLRWARVRGLGGAVTAAFSTNPTTALYWRMGFRPDAARTYSYFTRPLAS